MFQTNKHFSEWIQIFLRRRTLEKPDGRSLYAYHCNYEEYHQLRNALKESNPHVICQSKMAVACFVFFCSEWYRREYQTNDGWSWDAIWQSLGFEISAQERGEIVLQGLQNYWGRPVQTYESERRNLLGSLFAEGGLPLKVLQEEGSKFNSFFDYLLRHSEQALLFGKTISQFIEMSVDEARLPQAFLAEHSISLMAEMLTSLQSLVRIFELENESDPAASLDKKNPTWRESFPIPLDNETGTNFLNTLLLTAKEASNRRRAGTADRWSCHYYWSEIAPESFLAEIEMPSKVRFPLIIEPTTTRFELNIYEAGQVLRSLGPGYATVENGVATISLRHRKVNIERKTLSAQLELVAIAGGIKISSIPIEGSSVPHGEVPLGFEVENNRWRLCRTGSFNTTSKDVLLALPESSVISQIEKSDDETALQQTTNIARLETYQVKGREQLRIDVNNSSDFFIIRTGHTSSSDLDFSFQGEQLELETNPGLTFIGLPKPSLGPEKLSYQIDNLDLYIGGKIVGEGRLQEMLGTNFVSVRTKSGETLLRRKIGVLPSDFRVETRGGSSASEGNIFIYTNQMCSFAIETENVSLKQNRFDGYVQLQLVAKKLPPASVKLIVRPNLVAEPIVIELPFPSSGCLAFDGDGNQLDSNISLDGLLGSRLYLFGGATGFARFDVELTLRGGSARNVYYHWQYKVDAKPIEISLFDLREQIISLLSLGADLDQLVRLQVTGSGQRQNFRIRRYSAELKYNFDLNYLSLGKPVSNERFLPKPTLMLLSEPIRSPIPLYSRQSQGVPTGEFELPTIIEKNGPWLVVPERGSSLTFRPLFILGKSPETSIQPGREITTLQAAVQSFRPNSETCPFSKVLKAMAQNPAHSSWHFLRELYDRYGYLPLSTFEVWKALFQHPDALAMALFKFEMDSEFLERIESEFPFLWEFFPIKEIYNARKLFGEFLVEMGLERETVDDLLAKMLERLSEVFSSYSDDLLRYLLNTPNPHQAYPSSQLKPVIHSWYLELIRKRSEATWPDYSAKKLLDWHKSQPDSLLTFATEIDYRNAVVYLPEYAAAIAAGKENLDDLFNPDEAIFFFRQIRSFDSEWFDSIFQASVLNNLDLLPD